MKYLIAGIIFLYFLFSGYTAHDDPDGIRGMSDRIIYADYLALIVVLIAVMTMRRIVFRWEMAWFAVYLALALVGVLGARNTVAGSVELLILGFNFFVALALLHFIVNYQRLTVAEIVQLFVIASTILAILGFIQFMFFRDLFGERPGGAVSGTFRNTGQAGAFFGLALAVAVPAVMSGLIKRNLLNIACIAVIFVVLFFTFKRAALIGSAIGLVAFALRLLMSDAASDRRIALIFLLSCLFVGPVLYVLFNYSIENVEAMRWRFEYKFREDAVEEFSEGFFAENIDATMLALGDHPLMGSGLGNIIGQYTAKYEIHSTYLSVLANTGLLGVSAYALFMMFWIYGIFKHSGAGSAEERFLAYLLPFILGLLISWIYTYHLRKREFWILFVLTLAIQFVIERARAGRQPRGHSIQGHRGQASAGIAMRRQMPLGGVERWR